MDHSTQSVAQQPIQGQGATNHMLQPTVVQASLPNQFNGFKKPNCSNSLMPRTGVFQMTTSRLSSPINGSNSDFIDRSMIPNFLNQNSLNPKPIDNLPSRRPFPLRMLASPASVQTVTETSSDSEQSDDEPMDLRLSQRKCLWGECQKWFTSTKSWETHIYGHVGETELFECKYANCKNHLKLFAFACHLKSHLKPTNLKCFPCGGCRRHCQWHGQKSQRYTCPVEQCNRRLQRSNELLIKHLVTKHSAQQMRQRSGCFCSENFLELCRKPQVAKTSSVLRDCKEALRETRALETLAAIGTSTSLEIPSSLDFSEFTNRRILNEVASRTFDIGRAIETPTSLEVPFNSQRCIAGNVILESGASREDSSDKPETVYEVDKLSTSESKSIVSNQQNPIRLRPTDESTNSSSEVSDLGIRLFRCERCRELFHQECICGILDLKNRLTMSNDCPIEDNESNVILDYSNKIIPESTKILDSANPIPKEIPNSSVASEQSIQILIANKFNPIPQNYLYNLILTPISIVKITQLNQSPTIPCGYCHKEFKRRHDLTRHINTVHAKRLKAFRHSLIGSNATEIIDHEMPIRPMTELNRQHISLMDNNKQMPNNVELKINQIESNSADNCGTLKHFLSQHNEIQLQSKSNQDNCSEPKSSLIPDKSESSLDVIHPGHSDNPIGTSKKTATQTGTSNSDNSTLHHFKSQRKPTKIRNIKQRIKSSTCGKRFRKRGLADHIIKVHRYKGQVTPKSKSTKPVASRVVPIGTQETELSPPNRPLTRRLVRLQNLISGSKESGIRLNHSSSQTRHKRRKHSRRILCSV